MVKSLCPVSRATPLSVPYTAQAQGQTEEIAIDFFLTGIIASVITNTRTCPYPSVTLVETFRSFQS